jgi:Xaa-Pro aminopeptidase
MGHGISVAPTAEDIPKISANEETVFQPGMCISMECSYMAARVLQHRDLTTLKTPL